MGEVLATRQDQPDAQVMRRAARVLLDGGVVIMPTDSVYGIGCAAVAGNPAHGRVFELKQRDRAMTLPWLVSDLDALDEFGSEVPGWMRDLAREFWPGALTLVVRGTSQVPPEYLRCGDGTLALRMPDSELVRGLSRAVGVPLAVTSANIHGRPAATSGGSVERALVEAADLTLDAGPAPLAVASTIVGVADGRPRVLREGALPAAEVLRAVR